MRRRLLLIGHRGASAVAPENTRAAILAAFRAGADMVELDVQMTRDGRLVIFHDDRLERTTNGTGRLSASRYADLTPLDAGSWFAPRFARERILLLSQALRLPPRQMTLNLELKWTPKRQALIRAVLRTIRTARVSRRVLVSSFDARLLRPLVSTGLRYALICRTNPDRSLRQAIRLRCAAWHPFSTLITPRRITTAHAAGLRVHVWTVDDPRRARQLIRLGIDGLFTNHPARLRTVVG